ncbi:MULTISPECIES: LacI family DNA-binding transcriptional regulator [Erwiniaceae]|uniref:Transcriptional regulator n=1 Tax=Pantoea rwandensis TaxID=1076550 RepID=A0ABM5RD25_9GAMM|nr:MULTISPECIES: LacI family DNA-binding transcriptional regulator [Erwiniaceae]AIR83970.1 transcriptional regulator [Pantoea rwandensis]MBK0091755.1 LacI family DNA-binding transcriptional regulator [Erwinia sp. S59]MBK0125980.1 LacI family DNA-binding transcriptional regulator [Pantoea sp. S61]HAU5565390.1 LacI family transcriptional regulator [Serratia fonticola]
MKALTLAELAKQVGVGVATVDRVLNDRGGVSPAMTKKILQAARDAGLKRILPEEHRHSWQIEVLLSGNGSFFFQQLAQDFARLADELGYRRLRLHRTLIPENAPEKLAAHIAASSKKMDALIVFAHENPLIYDALAACQARGVPVITMVTDLPNAARLCHVGIDQYKAGRTAGLMLGSMINAPGDVVLVSGRADYSAHRQRIEGFQAVLAERFPQLRLREILAGQDERDRISRLLEKTLAGSQNIVGLYNTGLGNTQIHEALARHRLGGKVVYVTHELYATTRQLFEKRVLTLTLDQNTLRHAQLALTLLLKHLEEGEQPDTYQSGKVDFMLFTQENFS